MIRFTATILRFEQQGEKTGWSYIVVPAHLAQELKPGNRKAFRVKGSLDNFPVKSVSLLPAGGGDFIMAINAAMRKGTGKREGAMLMAALEADSGELVIPADFTAYLEADGDARAFFYSLPKGHQRYWVNWIEGVKGEAARQSRLSRAVVALSKATGFGEMLRAEKAARL